MPDRTREHPLRDARDALLELGEAYPLTVPTGLVRAIGAVEILGAAGLVLPPLTGIAPGLAMAAAIGLLVPQVLATALHLSRSEVKETGLDVALIVLAAVAARLATTW
ncbi:DoxX family protein [Streptomyces sp. NPDC091387]|uniref:DoxX family protein n=1 Tax=Streptomyces sp. NPDC091387 TaxID=3365998 RepID=UPI00382AFEFE